MRCRALRFARGYRKFVAKCVDSVLVLALKSPFTTIIIIIAMTTDSKKQERDTIEKV